MTDRRECWSRREFVGGLTLAGTAGLLGVRPEHAAADPPPETTKIRLARAPSICWAPQYMTEELLRTEGFTDVQYIAWQGTSEATRAVAAGDVDITKEIPYDKWREYDHEDTVRFYALRLRAAGMIKSSPQKIIARGTAWRFLNERKEELKG